MNESTVYNESDLAPFSKRVDELREMVRHDKESGKHPEAMTKLLDRQLKECGTSCPPSIQSHYSLIFLFSDKILESLQDSLSELSVELIPIHERLVTLRRQLVALAAKDKPSKSELKPIQEELRKIDSLSTSSAQRSITLLPVRMSILTVSYFPTAMSLRQRVDGKFLGPGGSSVPTSQALCSSLLEECFEIAQEIKAREDSKNVSFALKPIYDRLSEIRAELENLVFTRRWSLRETDLWNYTVSLREIDKMRVDGKFVDAEGNKPAGQYVN